MALTYLETVVVGMQHIGEFRAYHLSPIHTLQPPGEEALAPRAHARSPITPIWPSESHKLTNFKSNLSLLVKSAWKWEAGIKQ